MSGNRFHNKYHKHNHHTDPTTGDIDSSNDPIASSSSPFLGDFHLAGSLLSNGVDAVSGDIDNLTSSSLSTDDITAFNSSFITINSDLNMNANDILGFELDGISDVTVPTPALNNVLKWDGGAWVNSVTPIAEDAIGLTEINDNIWGAGLNIAGSKITSTNTTPVGAVIMWMGDVIPTNWLECNGQAVLTATYGDLFTVIGDVYGRDSLSTIEFHLPDMRGMFPRGLDTGRGGSYGDPDGGVRGSSTSSDNGAIDGNFVHSGRTVGSVQGDEYISHDHSITLESTDESGYTNEARFSRSLSSIGNFLVSTDDSGGSETRPNNMYVRFIMKVLP